jgi:hypothetical protein
MHIDLFSTRKRLAQSKGDDVYIYDDVPAKLRIQLALIFLSAVGDSSNKFGNDAWNAVRQILCKEHGTYTLSRSQYTDGFLAEDVLNYFHQLKNIDYCLDVIELCCILIDGHIRESVEAHFDPRSKPSVTDLQKPDSAIEEVNLRLRRASIGYRYEAEKLIRVDDDITHEHIVKPAIHFLGSDKRLANARSEFLSAHEHYRKGEHEDALVDALRSYESVMKVVLDSHGIAMSGKENCSDLVKLIWSNSIVPPYMQTQLSGLKSMLETSVATIRNKLGGHGQGTTSQHVPDEYVAYVISTASAAISLIGSHLK